MRGFSSCWSLAIPLITVPLLLWLPAVLGNGEITDCQLVDWWEVGSTGTFEQRFSVAGGQEERHNMTWTITSSNETHFEARIVSWTNTSFANGSISVQEFASYVTVVRDSRLIVSSSFEIGDIPYWMFWINPANLTLNTPILSAYTNAPPVREEIVMIMGAELECWVTETHYGGYKEVANMTRWWDKESGLVVKILTHDMRYAPYEVIVTETLVDTTFAFPDSQTANTTQIGKQTEKGDFTTPWCSLLLISAALLLWLRRTGRAKIFSWILP